MSLKRIEGKLAVILHADIVGSTSLMQLNQHLAHQRIQTAFDRFKKQIERYGGNVIELRGDAILATFEQGAQAVLAAMQFQSDNHRLNETIDDPVKPVLRVGITLGEIVVTDSTANGAGVVQAQRIEQVAGSGGVCISSTIQEALPKDLSLTFNSLGEQSLKGFDHKVSVYEVLLAPGAELPPPDLFQSRAGRLHGFRPVYLLTVAAIAIAVISLLVINRNTALFPLDGETRTSTTAENVTAEQTSKPSIAVLPFSDTEGEGSQNYLVDGIVEDIITDLSKLEQLTVLSSNSSFAYRDKSVNPQAIGQNLNVGYLLDGSVRRFDGRIRLSVKLIDTRNGAQIWAERFDGELQDIFTLQDDIIEKTVASLAITLTEPEKEKITTRATNVVEAYDLFLQGQKQAATFSREGLVRAIQVYNQVIGLDPSYARAYGAMAVVTMRQYLSNYTDTPAFTRDKALELAKKAVSVDPDSQHTQWSLGFVHMYRGEFDDAEKAIRKAIEIAPSYADGYALLALINNNTGQGEKAIALIEKAMTLNPHYSWDYLYNLGRAHYQIGQYETALDFLSRGLERNLAPRLMQLFYIATLVQLDKIDDAEWAVMQFQTRYPEADLDHVIRSLLVIQEENLREKLVTDLRAAGFS